MPRESDIIAGLKKRPSVKRDVLLGIGDDAAVIKTEEGRELLACCDLMVEGVHFRTDWSPASLLGRKALAVNLSDVAAMGGVPKFAMLSLALPEWCSDDFIAELFDGVFKLAEATGVSIIGGDTSSSRDSLFIDVSVIGECETGKAVTRRGAKVGDTIYVSGSLGASVLGLSLLEEGFRLDDTQDPNDSRLQAVRKHLVPEPRLELGRALGHAGLATAMIDISDGLSTDLWHILDESWVGAVIHASAIPVAECVTAIALEDNTIDPLMLALNGGEEYELLFTASPGKTQEIEKLSDLPGVKIYGIGEIVARRDLLLARNDAFESISPTGFEHRI